MTNFKKYFLCHKGVRSLSFYFSPGKNSLFFLYKRHIFYWQAYISAIFYKQIRNCALQRLIGYIFFPEGYPQVSQEVANFLFPIFTSKTLKSLLSGITGSSVFPRRDKSHVFPWTWLLFFFCVAARKKSRRNSAVTPGFLLRMSQSLLRMISAWPLSL